MSIVTDRAIQIFNFVKALYELKYPIVPDMKKYEWKISLDEIPEYETISIGQPFSCKETKENEDYILKVRRPNLTECPLLPEALKEWIEGDWADPFTEISPIQSKEITYKEGFEEKTKLELFNDDEERTQSFNKWVLSRREWAEEEKIARKASRVYEKIYSLHTLFNREGDRIELILGDGFFYCPDNGYEHPVLLLRVQLDFEPSIPEFTISPTEKSTELYSRFIRNIPKIDTSKTSFFTEKIEEDSLYPYDGESVDNLVKEMVQAFSPKGIYLENKNNVEGGNAELISYRAPVFFVRKRESDYLSSINNILDDIKDSEKLPSCLINIAGIGESNVPIEGLYSDESLEGKLFRVNGISRDILFSKPANEEQLLIAQKIAYSNSVLVQGPPGTGKTHTIANLIGHFMAQGKNILVTSYSSKALKVLRGQLPKTLQPLCVSLLDESKQQLEEAINNINSHATKDNPETLNKAALQLEEKRERILNDLAQEKRNLKAIIDSEYDPITFLGTDYSPKEAAKYVGDNEEKYGWIPGRVAPFTPMLLRSEELEELYHTNEIINKENETYLSSSLPDINELVNPQDYRSIVEIINSSEITECDNHFWKAIKGEQKIEILRKIKNILNETRELFSDPQEWKYSAAFAGSNRSLYFKPWEMLFQSIDEVIELGAKVGAIVLEYDISVPNEKLTEATLLCLNEILLKFKDNKTLPKIALVLKPDWKHLIETCKINNSPPTTKRHFEVLQLFISYKLRQINLQSIFKKMITAYGGPDLSNATKVEISMKEWSSKAKQYIDWFENDWLVLKLLLIESGFDWENFYSGISFIPSEYGDIERLLYALTEALPVLIEPEVKHCTIENAKKELQQYLQHLNKLSSCILLNELKNYVKEKDPNGYTIIYNKLLELDKLKPFYHVRLNLLLKLKNLAPQWERAIRMREDIHAASIPPASPNEAWLWSQLNQELDRRANLNITKVQHNIERLNYALMDTTEELINKKAWFAELLSIKDLKKKMALAGWASMVKLIGSGKGKRARSLIHQAKEQMKLCQSSVPVWIMPLNRVMENFNPGETKFDVVIIDEASQVDVMGLVALYLGKKVIVVGDNKQVTPVSVGLDISTVEQLQREYLKGIPNAGLYNELLSVYDMANWSFEPIRLKEHFRCAKPIIEFSNRHSYNGDILPMRDCSLVQRKPHTIAYKVEGTSELKVNKTEAETIVSLLKACTEFNEYKDASFGVMSIVGDEQALLIDEMLRLNLEESQYEKHQILCGNPSHFQGDERDVIFISMVDSPRGNGIPLPRREDGYNDLYAKRYNVAASRAKDQLWVIHSLNPDNDLKSGDIRGSLIKHALDPEAAENSINLNLKKAESEFERLVIRALSQRGYCVQPQWPVGSYRLDIVVEYDGKRVVIECDGEKYHTPEKLIEDMSRQAILERLGWQFIRIRGSKFFRNQDLTITEVIKELEEHEIFPAQHQTSENSNNNQLKDMIIKRAYEILAGGGIISNPEKAKRKAWGEPKRKDSDAKKEDSKSNFLKIPDFKIPPKESVSITPPVTSKPTQLTIDDMKSTSHTIIKVPNLTREMKHNNPPPIGVFDIVVYLRQKGYEVIDNRKTSRIIWVLGDLNREIDFLKTKGYIFEFNPRGAIATGNRSAWRCIK